MNQLTNNNGFGLAMAVWLAHDEYTNGADDFPGRDVISVTSLIKPTRQLILNNRVPPQDRVSDLADLIRSRGGNAIHDAVEHAWKTGYRNSMKKLGYPNKVIDKVRINPETVQDGDIPVYLEQRYHREFQGVIITGKFDQIIDGELNDTKTTSVFTYLRGNKVEDYQLQLSLYRWICPDKVTSDVARIQHYFTDWQGFMAKTNPDYPKHPIIEKKIQLLSIKETEQWLRAKFAEIVANQGLDEEQMIRCSDADLWRSDPEFKYYADATKAQAGGRSTKNFDTLVAANAYCAKQQKGVVVTIPSKVKACSYCAAFDICSQQKEYEGDHERS
jgi:hypothetical protein